jgi:hypothetical protein
MLEAEAALTEIDLARDAGVDHPLQGAVDRRAADALVLTPDQVDQIVGAQVPFLTEKNVEDEIPFARAFRPCGTDAIEI